MPRVQRLEVSLDQIKRKSASSKTSTVAETEPTSSTVSNAAVQEQANDISSAVAVSRDESRADDVRATAEREKRVKQLEEVK